MGSCLGHCHLAKESFSLYKLYSKASDTVDIQISDLENTESVEHILDDSQSLQNQHGPSSDQKFKVAPKKSKLGRFKSIFSNIKNKYHENPGLRLEFLDEEWSLTDGDYSARTENFAIPSSTKMRSVKNQNSTSINSLDLEWEHLPEMAVFSSNVEKEELQSATSAGDWSRLSSADSLEWDPAEVEMKEEIDTETEQLLQEIEMLSSKTLRETQEWRVKMGEWEDEEERAYFQSVISAFKYYRTYSLQRVAKTEQYFKSLPAHHQKMMENYLQHLNEIKACIEANDYLIKMIILDADYMFANVHPMDHSHSQPVAVANPRPVEADMERVQATLKQLVRDWSEDGAQERKNCYQPIISEITSEFPREKRNSEEIKILVPGAGLGRLAFEIAKLGYTCQGNEFSLFMLLASQFVLNKCCYTNIHRVYPWIHQFVNNIKPEHQIKSVSFPDINPRDLCKNSSFTMAAGDFLEVYTESDSWDCVATCFFIDCANNIAAFIETIHKILKPGGIWINLGPLLYHFSDMPQEDSIEPSYEVVRQIILGLGFVIEKEETDLSTTYAQNPNSMLQYQYRSVFFTCRKSSTM